MNGSPGIRVVDTVCGKAVIDQAQEQIVEPRGYAEYHISLSVCQQDVFTHIVLTDLPHTVARLHNGRETCTYQDQDWNRKNLRQSWKACRTSLQKD